MPAIGVVALADVLAMAFNWAYVGSWTLMQCVKWANKPEQLKPWSADGGMAGTQSLGR